MKTLLFHFVKRQFYNSLTHNTDILGMDKKFDMGSHNAIVNSNRNEMHYGNHHPKPLQIQDHSGLYECLSK